MNREIITFGRYPKDTSGEKVPIEWLVLEKQGRKALLISQYGLDSKEYDPFNSDGRNATWETCSLRTWLNNEFMSQAFNEMKRNGSLKLW